MATVAETQAYLDEAKSPSLQTLGDMRAALKAFATEYSKFERQVAYLSQRLKDAEITEPDPEVVGKFEIGFQKLGAMRRQISEAERYLRGLYHSGKEFREWDQDLRVICEEKGYTV